MARPRHGQRRDPWQGWLGSWPCQSWPLLLSAALAAGLAAEATAGGAASGSGAPAPAATVRAIPDGDQLYIEQRLAKVRDGARSSHLSLRGSNDLPSITATAQTELTVRKGQVGVEPANGEALPDDGRATAVFGGHRVQLNRRGTVRDRHPLSEAEMAAILNGPLFQGFLTPLRQQQALQSVLHRADPKLSLSLPPSPAVVDANANALEAAINSRRLEQGRPPFQPLPAELAARNRAYLKPVLQAILAGASCDHDRSRWRAFQESLAGAGLKASSEVLSCGPLPGWDPRQVVDQWLSSPLHRAILLERPRATSLGCSTLSEGDQTVAFCTLWTPQR